MTIDVDELYDMHYQLLGIWQKLESHENNCEHRRAFSDLIQRCAYVLLIMKAFYEKRESIDHLRGAIMKCVTPSDILNIKLHDLEFEVHKLVYGEEE